MDAAVATSSELLGPYPPESPSPPADDLWSTRSGVAVQPVGRSSRMRVAAVKEFVSHPVDNLRVVLCGLDLDGVLCDIGAPVARRIAGRFGVATHPATWSRYDLRLLDLGLPEAHFTAFLEETFADPTLYEEAQPHDGACFAVAALRHAGWRVVGITARPDHLAPVTRAWLAAHRLALDAVHHTPVGTKAAVARRLGVRTTVEDNPHEAELLGAVCWSWLFARSTTRCRPAPRASPGRCRSTAPTAPASSTGWRRSWPGST